MDVVTGVAENDCGPVLVTFWAWTCRPSARMKAKPVPVMLDLDHIFVSADGGAWYTVFLPPLDIIVWLEVSLAESGIG